MLGAMWRLAPLACLWVFLAPSIARGQLDLIGEKQRLQSKQPPNVSNDLMDPVGRTRLHLTTRYSRSDPEDVFSDQALWSFNLQAFLRIKEGWAVQASLPFGLVSPPAGSNEFLVGNIRLGTAFGFGVRLERRDATKRSARFRIGGGVDLYIPTANTPNNGPNIAGEAAVQAVRNLHAFEPELFIDDAMMFRIRGHTQLSFNFLVIEAEVGVSPGFTLEANSDPLLLVSWAFRISAKPTYLVDPYIEAASSFHVVGRTDADLAAGTIGRDYDTPLWITPGLRFHFGTVDPAIFFGFNVEDFGIIFGIDLAGAAREYVRIRKDDADWIDSAD